MIVELKSVRKRFGDFCAVDGVSFGIPEGGIYGLIGPNGAGKTTTIRMTLRIFLPDEGEITVFGRPMDDAARDRIGYLPEERGLYQKMKVRNLLLFFARSHGLGAAAAGKVEYWLDRVELQSVAHKKVEELSKGMQQKIQFITTVMHEPELLILDEPFSGLDPINLQLMKDIVIERNQVGATVVFSTHNMEEAEKLCNGICLINKGKVLVSGDLGEIRRGYGKRSVVVEGEGELADIKKYDFIEHVDLYENYAEVKMKPGEDPQQMLKDLVAKVKIRRFEIMEPTLRNIFIDLVGGDREQERV